MLLTAGSLDPTFGLGGLVTTTIGGSASGSAAALQPDQKIIIAGAVAETNGKDTIAIARYLKSGQLDTSFGPSHSGVVLLDPALEVYEVQSVTVIQQPGQSDDGKIIVSGTWADSSVQTFGAAVVRLSADGSFDASFGHSGVVLDTRTSGALNGLAVEQNGDIVIAAATGGSVGSQSARPVIERFSENGTPDGTFANPGFAGPLFGADSTLGGLVLDGNDDIVAAGTEVVAGVTTLAVARFTVNGQPDPTFGDAGIGTVDGGPQLILGNVVSLAIDKPGRIVVLENGLRSDVRQFVVTRVNSNGSPDPSFSHGAFASIDFEDIGGNAMGGGPAAVAVQPDGEILIAGTTTVPNTSSGSESPVIFVFALASLKADGTLDAGFGAGGEVLTQFPATSGPNVERNAQAFTAIVQADGNMVLGGLGPGGFALARYIGGTGTSTTNPPPAPPQVGPIIIPPPPVTIGATVNVSASFTFDSSLGPCTAVWDWGDGTSTSGTVTESSGSGSVTGSHVYHVGGAFPVTVTVTESGGVTGQSTANPGVVVWEPLIGSLNGSLRLVSPLDALASDPSASGNATLQLDASFRTSGSPKGKVSLKVKAAHLSFKSTGFDWLALNGRSLLLEGRGTLDGTEAVRFFVSAAGSGRTGKVRIRLWDTATGAVVYDSQPGATLDAAPETAIHGGTIALHIKHSRNR